MAGKTKAPTRSSKSLRPTVAPMAAKSKASDDPGDDSDASGDVPASGDGAPAKARTATAKPDNEGAKSGEPEPTPAATATTGDIPAEAGPAERLPPELIPNTPATAASPPPGEAPRGDARSLRRHTSDGSEFCFVYRYDSSLVTRRGLVGKEGEWRVVDYPSSASAAHAYARRCSELCAEGFQDFRTRE